MRKPSLLKEEILHYLNDEWNDSLRKYSNGLWLTTRAFQIKLRDRGILTTWPTLSIRLNKLLVDESVEMIKTSAGECWKPKDDSFKI